MKYMMRLAMLELRLFATYFVRRVAEQHDYYEYLGR